MTERKTLASRSSKVSSARHLFPLFTLFLQPCWTYHTLANSWLHIPDYPSHETTGQDGRIPVATIITTVFDA